MKIAIIGAGYVGLSTAAILANTNNTVALIDINQERLTAIKQGRSFFYEEGIDPLIAKAVSSGTLVATDEYGDNIKEADVVFSCVGTPDKQDGSSNLEYVFSVAEKSASLMKRNSIYIQKSTVPVGTGESVQERMKRPDIAYISNPEFLREGTAIEDSIYFDRVVCGGNNTQAIDTVFTLFKAIVKQSDELIEIAGLTKKDSPIPPSYLQTSLESAELIKVTANAFLALKISFANSIAKLSDEVGADILEVMNAVGLDKRIGRSFLNAGRGYGGGCFPKDVSGLISSMKQHNADPQILEAAQDVNKSMSQYIVERLEKELGNLNGKAIAVLGLSFKAGTSDVRKSPGITIANLLVERGAKVRAYDPKANDEAKHSELNPNVSIEESTENTVKEVEATLITTEWSEFKEQKATRLAQLMTGKRILFDCMNIYNPSAAETAGLQYIGIGR